MRRMLLEALIAGKIGEGQVVLDSSSGNAGIAYAMIGAMMKLPVQIVVPGNAAKNEDAHSGSRSDLVQTDPMEGYDEALREGHRIHDTSRIASFIAISTPTTTTGSRTTTRPRPRDPCQTDGKLTHFVSGIGTGGTMTGVGRRSEEGNPGVEIVQIVPEDFPGIEGLKPLESPGDIIPKILDSSVVDQQGPRIQYGCRAPVRPARPIRIFAGQSSGAYLQGVYETAKRVRKGVIVTILNDIGERYMSTRLWEPGA